MAMALPRWARLSLLGGVLLLASAVGLFAYRALTHPVTLSVAAGSIDGEGVRIMSAVAARLAARNAHVRLNVVDAKSALAAAEALSSGKANLAVVRSDLGDLTDARTLVLLTHAVVLLIAPAGSPVKAMEDLRNRTLGVLGGPANRKIVETLSEEFELAPSRMGVQYLAAEDVRKAVQAKQIHALLAVVPISDRHLSALRSSFPPDGKRNPTLIAIDAAEAIALSVKGFESYELPKGTFRGAPAIPDEDLTTLRTPVYLVARKTLDNDTAAAVAKAIIELRRDLAGEFPLVNQIAAPDTDKDAAIPIHPGAKQYFDGDEKTFFDRFGDYIFYGTLILGSITSVLAALWKFLIGESTAPGRRLIDRADEMCARIRAAHTEDELEAVENEINAALRTELASLESSEAALNVVAARLERLIHLRSARLDGRGKVDETAAA
jgi:TRAP-type uncharacterized transport system substrate-binding protein